MWLHDSEVSVALRSMCKEYINVLPDLRNQEYRNIYKYLLASSCPSIRPSAGMCQLGSQWMDFREIWYLGLALKSAEKIWSLIKTGQKYREDFSMFYIADSDIRSSTIEDSTCYCCYSMATLSLLSIRCRSFSSTMGQLICELGRAKNPVC